MGISEKKCMKEWPEFKQAINDFYEMDGGLVLRDCVRGGKVEAFLSYFSTHQSLFRKCKADYFDLNSLYPAAIIKNSMPPRPPLLIRGADVDNIHILGNRFYYGNNTKSRKRIYGALYVKIWIDPLDGIEASFYPFLPIKHDNKSFCVTCKTCMLEKSDTPCEHSSVTERAWKDHYTTVDLEYALSLGYKIIAIYEALAHFEVTDCLAKNFQHLAAKKCATAYPNTTIPAARAGDKPTTHVCSSICKVVKCPHLLRYVEEINEELDLFPISIHDIETNKAAKEYFKIVMNSQIGKFAQNNLEKVHSKLIREASETYSLLSNPRLNVCAANLLANSETLLVQYFKDGAFEKLNRSFSCILGAFVTAYARVTLHESIRYLHKQGCIIVYVDTDSIVYLRNKYLHPKPILLNIHPTKMGAWKNEAPDEEMESGTFVGPKNYAMIFRKKLPDNRGKICKRRVVKIRGFNVKQKMAYQDLEKDMMKKMILNKMEYWQHTKRECGKQKLATQTQPLNNRITQTNIRVKNKFERQVLTQTWKKVYVNNTVSKRAYIFKTMQRMRTKHWKHLKTSAFINSMKYFTMPYGYSTSDVQLLYSQFQTLNTGQKYRK